MLGALRGVRVPALQDLLSGALGIAGTSRDAGSTLS